MSKNKDKKIRQLVGHVENQLGERAGKIFEQIVLSLDSEMSVSDIVFSRDLHIKHERFTEARARLIAGGYITFTPWLGRSGGRYGVGTIGNECIQRFDPQRLQQTATTPAIAIRQDGQQPAPTFVVVRPTHLDSRSTSVAA